MAASTSNSIASPIVGSRPPESLVAASPLSSLAYRLTLFYVFLLAGRVPEISSVLLGSSFYQILVLTVVLLALSVITGDLVRVASSRAGTLWIAFHLWVVFTVPFSGYRRGSFENLQPVLLLFFSVVFLGGFLAANATTLRKAIWAMAWAGVVALAWMQNTGVSDDTGRFQSMGTFANSNLVAIYLLIMMPFWAYIVVNRRYSWFTRIFFLAIVVFALVSVLRTGSRSGLMTIGLLAIPVFFSLGIAQRFQFIAVAAAAVVAVLAWAPTNLKERWATVVADQRTDVVTEGALGSSDARYALLLESMKMTLEHPFVGVGLGVYADVAASERQRVGEKAHWQVTHNMYTQISAETGIPGFILYLSALTLSIKGLWRVKQLTRGDPEARELHMAAVTILYAWLGFCFNGFFTSMATDFTMYMLVGFSLAVAFAYERAARGRAASNSLSAESNHAPVGNSIFFPQGNPGRRAQPVAAFRPASHQPVPAGDTPRPAPAGDNPRPAPAGDNSDAPWRRNPRRHPPSLGTPAR